VTEAPDKEVEEEWQRAEHSSNEKRMQRAQPQHARQQQYRQDLKQNNSIQKMKRAQSLHARQQHHLQDL
jgi:hypothetical protein